MIVIINEDIFKEVLEIIEEIKEKMFKSNPIIDNEAFYYYKESLEDLARKNGKCSINEEKN